MANITITKELGYICIDMGSYFPLTTAEEYHYFPTSGWGGLCKIRIGIEDGLEFHITHEASPINITHAAGLTNFMQVDSVNGVAPSSLSDLKDLIVGLIQN